jgi:hypothetical protein
MMRYFPAALSAARPWDSALRDLSQAGEAEKAQVEMLVLQNTGVTDAGLATWADSLTCTRWPSATRRSATRGWPTCATYLSCGVWTSAARE